MDIVTSLRNLSQTKSEGDLRQFACNCCRRLVPLFPDLDLEELISFGQDRCAGRCDPELQELLRNYFGRTYDSLYPGFGDPSPGVFALSAAGEVVFTDSALDASINALEFSVEAIARKAASESPDNEYDDAYEVAHTLERDLQLEMLRGFFRI